MRTFGKIAEQATITRHPMKRTFLTHFAIFVAILISAIAYPTTTNAQRTTGKEAAALKQIGDAIGKDLVSFTEAAKVAGFSQSKKQNEDGLTTMLMSGRICDQRRCKLLTAVSTEGDINVHHAGIFLQKRDKWSELTEDYSNVRTLLTEVYGNAKESAETFIGAEPTDDAGRMEALKSDKTDFTTKFESGNLTIMLSITYSEEQGAHVGILFIDTKLSELISTKE